VRPELELPLLLDPALELPLDEEPVEDDPELDSRGVEVPLLEPPCVYPWPFVTRPCGSAVMSGPDPRTTITIGWPPGYHP